MSTPSEGNELSFERDIKPSFRTKDRDSMLQAFDLFDYEDVVENADAIVGALRSGQMPCDGAWPGLLAQSGQCFSQWIDQGKPCLELGAQPSWLSGRLSGQGGSPKSGDDFSPGWRGIWPGHDPHAAAGDAAR